MALPGNITLITLTGKYLDFTGTPILGQVKIYPSQVLIDSAADRIIIPSTITTDLDSNGAFSVSVPITNDPDVSPLNYYYMFEESFAGGTTYVIYLPSSLGGTTDISDVRADAVITSFIQPIAYQLWPPFVARFIIQEDFYSESGAVPSGGTYNYLPLKYASYAAMAAGWATYAQAALPNLSFTPSELQLILDRMTRLQAYTATTADLRDTTNGGTVTGTTYGAAMAKWGTYTNLNNNYLTYGALSSATMSWTYSQVGTLLTQVGLSLNGQDPRVLTGLTDPLLSTTRSVSGTDYGALILTNLTNAQVATNYSTYDALAASTFSYSVRDWADRLRDSAIRPHELLMKDYRYGINI